jgi:uncharacterized spore protein YtfJ
VNTAIDAMAGRPCASGGSSITTTDADDLGTGSACGVSAEARAVVRLRDGMASWS